jgi:hypothetical protein
MHTVEIDWADLEIAFRDAGTESYLDRETGDVVSIVDGFDDERDLRDRLARFPGRFVRIVPVDRTFSTRVVERFLAAQKGPRARPLRDAFVGAGGLSRVMAALRDDKHLLQAFARYEQAELLKTIETFLASHGLSSAEQAPGLELFEGTA